MKKWVLLKAILLLLVLISANASALVYDSTYPYKLVGGINSRKFNFGSGSGLKTEARQAIQNWNNSPTNFYYTEGYGPTLTFMGYNYGSTGWYGYAYYRDFNGNYINPGYSPNDYWYYNDVLMNTYFSRGSSEWVRTAGHETGHSIGLLHSQDQFDLMYAYPNNVQRPQQNDIDTTNYLYP